MSDFDEKMERVSESSSSRALQWLDVRCKNLKAGKHVIKCTGLECARGYRVLEKDSRGPTLVESSSMDVSQPYRWRRVQIDQKTRELVMELEER